MKRILRYLIIYIFLNISTSLPLCKEGENHCIKCHNATNLCMKCDKSVYIPNELGGCDSIKTCQPNNNHCLECNSNKDLCVKCEFLYYPDENGGCSNTKNCAVSHNGNCLECKNDYILIGQELYEGIKICKSKKSLDLLHCNSTDLTTGFCLECEDNYYLGAEDMICTSTKNCSKSTYGLCTKCIAGFYLNKKDNECVFQNKTLVNCKVTLDNKTCDECEDGFYLEEGGACISIKYCLKGGSSCSKCADGYILTQKRDSCVKTENCVLGNKAIGICTQCKSGYYLDYRDGQCKSNSDNEDFQNCIEANGGCYQCTFGYQVGRDNRCTTSKNCDVSKDGTCIECESNYYLGLDNKCTKVKNCIYSNSYACIECKEGYYYNRNTEKCVIAEGDFKKCKIGYGTEYCLRCKNEYYLNQTDHACYDNDIQNDFYKCSMSNDNAEYCIDCSNGYYLSEKDHKCTLNEGCILFNEENKCIECGQSYVLDVKEGMCHDNDVILDENKKFYYRCNRTNEEGTACEICEEGNYTINENGLCFDDAHCVNMTETGECLNCQNDFNGTYCLNEYFGCEPMIFDNCLECNDLLDLYKCTKCIDGYEVNQYNICVPKKK